mgnify:CR=1 FL=1
MSEPEPDDDGARRARAPLPAWWGRAAGAGLLALAAVLTATAGGTFLSFALGMAGLALAVFGSDVTPIVEGDVAAPAPDGAAPEQETTRKARLALAALGGASLALGLAWVGVDALGEERASLAWAPVVAGGALLVAAAVWDASRALAPVALRARGPSGPAAQGAVALAVAGALAAQIAVPATYYLGDDPFDERFAWRMFSAVRVYRCELTAEDLGGGAAPPVRPDAPIPAGWIPPMRRGREPVIARYLRWRCEDDEVSGARVTNRCTTPDGERVPDVVRDIDCASGALRTLEIE